ncbi:MAG TPA: FAD-dependent oxidoreductase [Acidobacteriaceae bacterium]|nr:FAD-dependent oxidoreductase [Acidobacteriaceae bacterium]
MRRVRKTQLKSIYDIAVIGSGFAGSLFAMIARRLGHSVILVERGRHPRVVIGESSTPLSNLLLEDLAKRYDLPLVQPLTKWGSWQRHYPNVACGLKRGFSFFHHDLQRGDLAEASPENSFLVAASPHNAIADTHWYRADFDQLLLEQAQQLGVEYVDETHLQHFSDATNHAELTGKRRDKEVVVHASFIVDATGPRGCLHHLLGLPQQHFPNYPATQALYSHFRGISREVENRRAHGSDCPPYPIEDAAVHHIFDGGWVWLLHFNNGVTSAGVAATDAVAQELRLADGQAAWGRLLHRIPSLAAQFADAKAIISFTHIQRLAFRSSTIVGNRWALLPAAAGFVDPLLSTGFPLTLLGIGRLAAAMEEHWQRPSLQDELSRYAASTHAELDATARVIAALYANMNNSEAFRTISLLYFAAASFSETVRRLDRPHLAEGFLLHNDPRFGPASRNLLERARGGVAATATSHFLQEVRRAIGPFDLAGLCAERVPPWYPVDAEDLRRSAWKVGATQDEIAQMLERSGFSNQR